MADEKFRSHSYIITEDGHLKPCARTADYHAWQQWKRRNSYDLVDRVNPPKETEELEPIQCSIPEPEPEPEPPAYISPEPEKSTHRSNVDKVAALLREGKSYSEAMDLVLDGEETPEPARHSNIPPDIQPYFVALGKLREALALQREAKGKKMKPWAGWRAPIDPFFSDGGNFERRAVSLIQDGVDIGPSLDKREEALRLWISQPDKYRVDTSESQQEKVLAVVQSIELVKKKPPVRARIYAAAALADTAIGKIAPGKIARKTKEELA